MYWRNSLSVVAAGPGATSSPRKSFERAHLDEFAPQLDSPDQDLEVGVAFQVVWARITAGSKVVARAQADATRALGARHRRKNVNRARRGRPRGSSGAR